FWWAWRYFLRVEEAGWTGGEIAFPGSRTARAASGSAGRVYRPLSALLWKELQLHLVGLAGMGGLFILHLGVVAVRKAGEATFGDALRSALELFAGIWLIVPLLVGGPSVAEERKLGTLQEQLCLPVSRRIQFLIKLGMVLLVGGLLSAVLVWTVEGVSGAVGLRSSMGKPFQGQALAEMAGLFMALSLLSFYASTLARNLVQALAVAVVTAMGVGIFAAIASGPIDFVWRWLWRCDLVYYITWPVLGVAFLWLAWRNFRSGAESEHLWRRNLLGLLTALALICGVTSALYHRAWEWIPPREPAHGPARLAVTQPVQLKSDGNAVAILTADGRLWVERFGYKQGRQVVAFQGASMPGWVERGIRVGASLQKLSRNPGVAGTNWTDAVASSREVVAIRADGTLWVSERPRVPQDPAPGAASPMESAAALVQFGQATDWKSVVQEYYPWSVVLLKQDGSLWRWGTNSFSDRLNWPGLRAFEPLRLTAQTGWTRILQGIGCLYAWKGDDSAWAIHAPDKGGETTGLELGVVVERVPSFDHIQWRSVNQFGECRVGLRADGSLWAWNVRRSKNGMAESYEPTRMRRIGSAMNWVALAGNWRDLAALQSDGSLWKWDNSDNWGKEMQLLTKSPTRLSTHSDWVGLGLGCWGIVSLAADGSLWSWYSPVSYEQPMLAPSRKPVRLDNILASQR
ncbi:MAG TPA: hypothetical protein VNZ22_00905, partial [Bacillota bacterium]|nr:hypothetical protein [Bacillota bacterium]